MSDKFAKRVTDAGIDLSDTASYLYSPPVGMRGTQFLIPMPKPVGPNPNYVPTPEPTPEPIYTPPPMVPNIPKIPNIDLSNLPKFNSQTTSGRPMIPKFGNFDLR